MKIKFVKTVFATACVVAVGMGCFKAYNASNQSESSMLLAENVEALSDEDGDGPLDPCWMYFASLEPESCPSQQTTSTSTSGKNVGASVSYQGVTIGVSAGNSTSTTTTSTVYGPKEKHVCKTWSLTRCWKKDQTDCNGVHYVKNC